MTTGPWTDKIFILYVVIGYGYVFYQVAGKFTLNTILQPYNKLFNKKIFLKHLIFAVALGIGSLPLMLKYDSRAAFLNAPLFFLLLLKFGNAYVNQEEGRNLYFVAAWDKAPTDILFLDRIWSYFIFVLSIIIPGFIMNYFSS